MTTYDELREMIQCSDPSHAPNGGWLNDDGVGIYTLKADVRVNLVVERDDHDHLSQFSEPWAEKFPDRRASKLTLTLKYSGAYVEGYTIILVDGARAKIPLPSTSLELDTYSYHLAQILNHDHERLDHAIKVAGIRLI